MTPVVVRPLAAHEPREPKLQYGIYRITAVLPGGIALLPPSGPRLVLGTHVYYVHWRV